MIVKPGETFSFGGKKFTIGGEVWANGNSVYARLFGSVTDIRDGADRETDNETPEIYCAFEVPESDSETLEDRFPKLYGVQKALDGIPLDSVVMAPDMLEPVTAELPESCQQQYVLCVFSDSDAVADILGISANLGLLLRLMLADAEKRTGLMLTFTTVTAEYMSFTYEMEDRWCDDPEIIYTITPAPVYHATEGGATV